MRPKGHGIVEEEKMCVCVCVCPFLSGTLNGLILCGLPEMNDSRVKVAKPKNVASLSLAPENRVICEWQTELG